MSTRVIDLKNFLAEFEDDDEVCVDEGGLCLEVYQQEGNTNPFYYELGGKSED